jgi:uncharacterized membrane protein
MAQIVTDLGSQRRNFYQSSSPDFPIAAGVLVIIAIVALVFIVFSILWYVAFFFSIPLVMERDLSPMEAIKLSARAGFSNIGGFILLVILLALVGLLGVIMCFFGVLLISVPVTYAAYAVAYRQVFPYFERQAFNNMPPPPGTYGSNYGQGI